MLTRKASNEQMEADKAIQRYYLPKGAAGFSSLNEQYTRKALGIHNTSCDVNAHNERKVTHAPSLASNDFAYPDMQ